MVVAGGGLDDNTIEILWDTQDNTTVSVSYDAANACSSGGPVTINEIVSVCGDLAITTGINTWEFSKYENIDTTFSRPDMGSNDVSVWISSISGGENNYQILEIYPLCRSI